MARLFKDDVETCATRPAEDARVVSVVVSANVWRSFDYFWPGGPAGLGEPAVGQRVHVPFGKGNRKTLGFVVDDRRPPSERSLKPVSDVIDPEPQLDDTLRRLGDWISRYYLTPLGMTLAAMVPSAVGRHGKRTETVAHLTSGRSDWTGRLGSRQRRVLDELLEAREQGVEPLRVEQLLRHSGASSASVRGLAGRELIRLETRPVSLADLSDDTEADPFELNADQKSVMSALEAKLDGGFSATLLHGVTGSGKTEVYVRAIRRVIAAGRQAILLVPEIALATQTLHRLLRRLPRVAVLHSGLTGAQRAFHYEQIRDGIAAVVVGPRSAVFAPARKLGLIVVDEEHEQSYKQDTAPRYHGRDVAVKRASLADVPVLLGSATPSLESLHNAQAGRYDLLRLPHRVRGLPMPKLRIVNLRDELSGAAPGPGGPKPPGRRPRGSAPKPVRRIELIGKTLTHAIASALDRGEQVILLMNRRGYASYVFCPSSGWLMMCEQCSRPMVYHRATALAMCHHCDRTDPLPERCPVSGGKLVLFGYGIQRIEGELARKFPQARAARMDSDTMTSPKQFREVFDAFAAGKVDILLGTQMVAKGLDFPRVSLVGIVSADTSLVIPDFRASERTFQLIVQVAGRAGRAETPGRVVVQTLHSAEPAIQFAEKHDYDGFAAHELPLRRHAGVPPFSRMIRFVVRHAQQQRAQTGSAELAGRLRRLMTGEPVSVQGPQPAGAVRLRNQFRFEVRLSTQRAGVMQKVLFPRMAALVRDIHAEVIADVDPSQFL